MSLRHSGEEEITLMKRVYLIVGRSAVGKDTVVRKICHDTGLKQIISYTTRPRRNGEGDTHVFITPEQATKITDKLCVTVINNYEYFITPQQLEDGDIYIVDPRGAQELRSWNQNEYCFHIFNIWLPADVRQERIAARGDDPKVAATRCADEDVMFSEFEANKNNWDNSVKNIVLEDTVSRLEHIIYSKWNEALAEIIDHLSKDEPELYDMMQGIFKTREDD